MISFQAPNKKKFADQLMNWAQRTEQDAVDVTRGLAAELFHRLLQNSPQYSGDYAANWRLSQNVVDTRFERVQIGMPDEGAYIVGDKPAINYAISANRGLEAGATLTTSFYISNSAVHSGDAYALKIERGTIDFRHPNKGQVISRSVGEMFPRYQKLSSYQFNKLRRSKV